MLWLQKIQMLRTALHKHQNPNFLLKVHPESKFRRSLVHNIKMDNSIYKEVKPISILFCIYDLNRYLQVKSFVQGLFKFAYVLKKNSYSHFFTDFNELFYVNYYLNQWLFSLLVNRQFHIKFLIFRKEVYSSLHNSISSYLDCTVVWFSTTSTWCRGGSTTPST